MPRITTALIMCGVLFATFSCTQQSETPFDSSSLVKPGDHVKYGSYVVYKIGEGIYKINDPGTTTGRYGAWGVDMYLICGEDKALMIDLGNNYIDGCEQDLIEPRENAAEELRDVVYELIGKLPLEIAISHLHPDHDGMAGAFLDSEVTFWVGEGENIAAIQSQHNIDPSILTVFTQGEKTFDLGGERIVETLLVRGHSNGHTIFILKKDLLLFTIDAYGNGVGQTFRSVESLKIFAEDAQKLVDYISANFSPYERYGLRVYVGHTWLNVYSPYYSPNKEKVDIGYLDWRYVQNLCSCAKGILEGKWLVEGSGLLHVGNMSQVDWWGTAGQAIMVYDLGTIVIPLELAFEAAGLEMSD
ncbi:MAG: MBL fold metallo-hydrolase [Bacteroidales bacterium]|nr:MBL fold metallo-hydrolase [Bacteroidales bacterium]